MEPPLWWCGDGGACCAPAPPVPPPPAPPLSVPILPTKSAMFHSSDTALSAVLISCLCAPYAATSRITSTRTSSGTHGTKSCARSWTDSKAAWTDPSSAEGFSAAARRRRMTGTQAYPSPSPSRCSTCWVRRVRRGRVHPVR